MSPHRSAEKAVVVSIEGRAEAVREVRVSRRQLWRVGETVEVVLREEGVRGVDRRARALANTGAGSDVQVRGKQLRRHVEQRIARHLLLAVDGGLTEDVDRVLAGCRGAEDRRLQEQLTEGNRVAGVGGGEEILVKHRLLTAARAGRPVLPEADRQRAATR